MNFDIFNEIAKMSVEQIEERLNSVFFTENESKLFQKGIDFINQGLKMTPNDSGQKVFDAVILYCAINQKELKK